LYLVFFFAVILAIEEHLEQIEDSADNSNFGHALTTTTTTQFADEVVESSEPPAAKSSKRQRA